MLINVATCNFEYNGGGNQTLWRRMHDRLASLDLHLLLRQEMWGAQDNDNELADAAEAVLGMTGRIARECSTAVYHDPKLFTPAGEYPKTGPWLLPPTVRQFQLTGTAADAAPLFVGSFHYDYASPAARLAETEWLTRLNDRWARRGDGRRVHCPALLGGDTNSYPVAGTPGDPALPILEKIGDEPHRAHRSYIGPDGTRLMDDRPDATLRTAGLQDVARHLTTVTGDTSPVAPTVDACDHGPDARIDRIYASKQLLPAVRAVEVVDMTGLSDHHTVVLRLDRDTLTDILNHPLTRTQ